MRVLCLRLRTPSGLHLLYRRGSHGAAHDSGEQAPKCHPETRKTIVADIMSWIGDSSRTTRVLWFNGPAGAGKTAIAQTLCKRCVENLWLAGSFFFSRMAPLARNDPAYLFPTIAYQLSLAIPAVGEVIHEVVTKDPSLISKALKIQLQKLIVEPMQQVLDIPNRPVVIIIDGLDECQGEGMQAHIIRLLGSVFQCPIGALSSVCFIVTSRPEPWIRNEFDMEPLSYITRPVFLGQTAEANDDIRTFFCAGFTEIHNSARHRSTMWNVERPWPSYRVLDDLVEKASGQFIYPATVLKFVDDPNYRPTDLLDIITSIPKVVSSPSTPKPLAALDRLYSQILSTARNKQRTREILGALMATQDALMTMQGETEVHLPNWTLQDADWLQFIRAFRLESLRIAEQLLGFQPGDGALALRTIHSLVHVPRRVLIPEVPDADLSCLEEIENSCRNELWFHHKSFIDYLVDPCRSLEYYINMHQVHLQLAVACLDRMQTFSSQPTSRIACGTFLQYSFLLLTLMSMQLLGVMRYFSGMITLWGQDPLRTSY